MLRKILVPVDGTDYSWRALDYAADLAKLSGASLLVLTVNTEEGTMPKGSAQLRSREEMVADQSDDTTVMQIGNEVLGAAKLILEAHPQVDCTYSLVESGQVVDAILEAQEDNGCDAIVIGSREKNFFKGFLKTSTSRAVLDRSSVPVIVVK